MSNVEKPFVLLVDDNEANCTLITAVLHRDFAVDVATDGNEAIDKLRTNQYSSILLDLKMPQADGFAVLDYLKENDPRRLRTVLVVTAALSGREIARAESYGICGIIRKPFDVDVLLELVKQCAAPGDGRPIGGVIYSIILIADFLRQRLM
jgi:CheY-like chemotaxis protein